MLHAMKYGYLIASSLYLIYWLLLYFKTKDHNLVRRWLWFFSLQFAVLGPIAAVVWFGDWWRPETVMGWKWGIEDVILGFTNGGLATCVWALVFRFDNFIPDHDRGSQDLQPNKSDVLLTLNKLKLILPLLIYIGLATVGLLIFQLNSFWANCLGLAVMTIFILATRIDLWRASLFSGLFMVGSATTIYLAMRFILPGWIEATWLFDKLMGPAFLGVPIEDYLWYFLVGAGLSLILPYAYGMKLELREW